MDPQKVCFEVWHARPSQENLVNKFCQPENSCFLNFCFYGPLMSRKKILTFAQYLAKNFVDLLKSFLRFFILDSTRKKGENLFCTGRAAFSFRKFAFSTTSLVLQKGSYNFHSICQIVLWTSKNCSLRFITLDNMRKITPKSFFSGECAFFFKNLWFQQPLRS